MKNFKKILTIMLTALMALSLVACGSKTDSNETAYEPQYTYQSYTSALAQDWNPHTWEMNSDSAILGYLSTPFVDMTVKDSTTGEYQWIFEAATDIQDVTAEHQDDLTKYNVNLPEGVSAEEVTEGYVYEITLNPNMKWEDGTPINADTYVYSMKAQLDPAMKNYRANNYYSGESAIAGAEEYFFSGSTAQQDNGATGAITAKEDLVLGADGVYTTADGGKVSFALTTSLEWLGGYDLATYVGAYGADYFDVDAYASLEALADENGLVPATDEAWDLMVAVISVPAWGEGAGYEVNYLVYDQTFDAVEWDTVGLYKVDDYTIRYVCDSAYDYYYFLTSMTSNWIVYEELYEGGKDTTGTLVTTNYNTSVETSMSYGPYKLESMQTDKQMVLVQNENWYDFEKQEDGSLLSMTDFLVDGESVQQYQLEKLVIDVMTDDAAKQAFMKGELDDWTPSADEVVNYSTSEQLYKVDETYTMRFFFHTNLEDLKTMDTSYGNTNSVVVSNENFRKAFSLAIDRAEWVGATAGYKPSYSMLSSLYFYDVYEDPASIYRNTDQAMTAITNLYGVEYGDGTPYATLEEAYKSINGYNLTEAKALMAQACQELVDAGLYTAGEDIVIRIGYKAGAMDSTDNQQMALFNEYINAAAEGSGFGKIELVGVDNLSNRYASTAAGEFAIGYGAWGGAAFYPFTMFRVYCDPSYVDPIHEAGCWDPSTETLTMTVNGEEVTMTWQAWSTSMTGTGKYANADNETKLSILAGLEENYLKMYYIIPLATTTSCSMLSYKTSYYTENYSIMYGFGGVRLQKFNYTNSEWADYVASQNGELNYE